MRMSLLATLSAALLSACTGNGPRLGAMSPARLQPAAASEVLQRIKQEVSNFNAFQASKAGDSALQNACKGQVAFAIDSVELGLILLNENTNGGSLGAKVPVVGMKFGPKGEVAVTSKSTIKVNMLFEPKDRPVAATGQIPDALPGSLDEALRTMRQAMLDASKQPPCMTFPKTQKNSVESKFQVVRKQDGSVSLEFIVFSAELKSVRSVDTSNTITINFRGVGKFNPMSPVSSKPGATWSDRILLDLGIKSIIDGSRELPQQEQPTTADQTAKPD